MVHKSYTKRLRLRNMEPNKIRCEGESEVEAVQQFLLHLWSPSCYSMKKCRDKSYERKQEGRDCDDDKWNINVIIYDINVIIYDINVIIYDINVIISDINVIIYDINVIIYDTDIT